VTRLGVAPFIATLGTLYVVRGAALLMSGGGTFANLAGDPALDNAGFPVIGAGCLCGVPVPVLLPAGAAVLAGRTPIGQWLRAVGGNERAALLPGVRVSRAKTLAYVLSGACAALAGLIVASDVLAALISWRQSGAAGGGRRAATSSSSSHRPSTTPSSARRRWVPSGRRVRQDIGR